MDDKEFTMNEYFTRRISDDKMLVTTRHGTFAILDRRELEMLKSGEFADDGKLFGMLKKEGILLTKENVGPIVNRFRHMFKEFDQSNFVCVVNMTEKCNLNCAYCLANAGPCSRNDDMDVQSMEKLIDFVNGAPWKFVSFEFQGGESLLRFDLMKKFVSVVENRLSPEKVVKGYSVVTNMSLMTEEIADYLISKGFNIGSSLDGPRELHDAQRAFPDGSGSYELAVKWGKYLKGRGAHIGFSPTITKRSVALGARAIIDEYLERGMEYILFRPVTMCGRASSNEGLAVGADEFIAFYKDGIDYMVELFGSGVHIHEKKLKAMLKNIFTPYRNYMCLRRPCGACMSQMSFMPDGSIYACDSGKGIQELKVGNFLSDGYADVVMNSLPIRALSSEAQPLCDTCAYNAFCGTCLSRAVTEHSDIVARTPEDFDCKVHKAMFDYIFLKMGDPNYMKAFRRWTGMAGAASEETEHTGI